MIANPPLTPTPEFSPSPKVQAEIAELRALEKQLPEPTWEEVRSDWEWLYAQFGNPAMEPYLGQLVAVYNGQVVGADPHDELALRIHLANEYRIHPERFVVSFYG